ncbi:MAG: FAD-dependent oxidoreductase [Bacteroidales bacterium]
MVFTGCQQPVGQIDVLIIGGGASGVTAGVQSARMDVNTLIVEETPWLGGMLTAAGVSAIDGNHKLPSGLWSEFRDSLRLHYGGAEALETGWVSNTLFEPSVGNRILHNMTANEPNLTVWKESSVEAIERNGEGWLVKVKTPQGVKSIDCKVLVDATELGDVAKECGVGYDIGMEDRAVTGEAIAPEAANTIVQDLTYVAILKDYGEDRTIARPEGYDSTRFACACQSELCISPIEEDRVWSPEMMITYGKLPNNKYMINWPIEGNDYYVNLVEMAPEERAKALEVAKNYTLQFVYYIQKELGMNHLGIADDEFPTADLFPYIPYHRESRRIHGEVRFDLNDVKAPYDQEDALYRTCIAVGDYPVDHHHKAYRGEENLPNLYFYPIPSYGLPAGCLIPKKVDDLIVAEKSISVSNLINGTTRLQPVVLQIGQAAGAMAALAVKQNKEVRELEVRDLQNELLKSGGYLLPYLDRERTDADFMALQRIGSTGILRGEGRNVEWSNQTWFRADTVLIGTELEGIREIYPAVAFDLKAEPLSMRDAVAMVNQIADVENIRHTTVDAAAAKYGIDIHQERAILRGEMAVLIDEVLDPFNSKNVSLRGELK